MAAIPQLLKSPSRIPALRAMQNRNFRWFWLSGLGQSTGQGMMQFALPWLVLSLPGTSLSQLGIVIALQGIPMVAFLLFGGVLADRLDRRRVLITGQLVMITNIGVLATLTVFDAVQIWHVYVTSSVTGIIQGFTMPARGSMVRFLVERDDIMNAVALNSMLMNSSRILGPAIAGGIISLAAVGLAFYVIGVLYALGVTGLLFVHVTSQQQSRAGGSPFSAIASGVRYIVATPLVLALVGLTLSLGFFGMPFAPLLPAFAKEVLDLGPGYAALLVLVTGIGSLTGNIGLAFMGDRRHKNRWAIGLLLLFAVTLIAFAVNPLFPLTFLILFFVGVGGTTFITVTNAMIQLTVPQQYLGRVVSFTQLAWRSCWSARCPWACWETPLACGWPSLPARPSCSSSRCSWASSIRRCAAQACKKRLARRGCVPVSDRYRVLRFGRLVTPGRPPAHRSWPWPASPRRSMPSR